MEKNKKLEFRYYEVQKDFPVLALLGKRWEIPYGTDPMHFHNHLEIGYCYYGTGEICHGNERTPYKKGTITVIPRNHLHRTTGNGDEIQKWEYLFIDAEQFLENMFHDDPVRGNKIQQIIEKRCLVLDEETAIEIGDCVKLCLREMREKKEFYKESAGCMLQALFVYVIRLYEREYSYMKNSVGGGGKNSRHCRECLII